jgi:hypothetical protein
MQKPTFSRACLSNIRVIMAIIHVPLVELLCQMVMGQNPALKYVLSGMCGQLWPCPIMPGNKSHVSRDPNTSRVYPVCGRLNEAPRFHPGCQKVALLCTPTPSVGALMTQRG